MVAEAAGVAGVVRVAGVLAGTAAAVTGDDVVAGAGVVATAVVVVTGAAVVVVATVVVAAGTPVVVVVGPVVDGAAVAGDAVAAGRAADEQAVPSSAAATSEAAIAGRPGRDLGSHFIDGSGSSFKVSSGRAAARVSGSAVRCQRYRPGPVAVLAALTVVLTGCGASGAGPTRSAGATVAPATTAVTPATTAVAPSTTVVPATTVAPATSVPATTAVAAVPAFAVTISDVTAADVPYTWRPGCPVPPADLRDLHLTYWGFDGAAHTGSIIVNASVATSVITVFRALYGERFPLAEMVPEDAYHGDDNAAAAADDTSGFNCRDVVAPGPPQWSVHAYGEAIDVNDVQNPYIDGSTVIPPAGRPYFDRADVRPGMAVPGGDLVEAFASVGWQWGGRWTGSPDYQHFSSTGG